ncbi:MAG: hypothetical protein SVV80_12455 [Planctomycetota bacterium]|nr:hypothetical protein [Planctomycetota bacterium]
MANECKDRDLLAIEPDVFTGGGFGSQQMAAGVDGAFNGTTFTSILADFTASNIQAGMVLCVYSTIPAEGRFYEIISVDSSTSLTVSVLRTDRDAGAVAPSPGTNLKYYINTFAPQIADAEATLYEKLRRLGEAEGISSVEFVESSQLRKTVAFASLASVFTALASNAVADDANWVKAEFYRRQHVTALGALRLAEDIDGDGFAEHTRTLSNVSLRRT